MRRAYDEVDELGGSMKDADAKAKKSMIAMNPGEGKLGTAADNMDYVEELLSTDLKNDPNEMKDFLASGDGDDGNGGDGSGGGGSGMDLARVDANSEELDLDAKDVKIEGAIISNELLDEFDPIKVKLVWKTGKPPGPSDVRNCDNWREGHIMTRIVPDW